MATSIFSRKRDLIYLIFFLTHLPIMLFFDLTGYYPEQVKPAWMTEVREWYVKTHGDRFFYAAPAFFPLYTLLELLFHLPFTIWAIPALLRNDPRLPLALLVFALETTVTTLTCLVEMWSWEELTGVQRGLGGLGGMYGGYLALAVFMAVDCYARLDQILSREKRIEPVTKKEL